MSEVGKLLIVCGLLIAGVGGVVVLAGRLPWLGRLPGDIAVHRGHFTFYFPLATSIVVSVVLTLIFWVIGRR